MPKLPPIDPDAQAFLTATGITDPTIRTAIDTLVVALKNNSLWTKMKAIYPMVGGTATTNKFNLKDPRDLDAAFRLVFFGGWTHSSNGVLPNGVNAYADTFLNSSTIVSQNNFHNSLYSRTNSFGLFNDLSVYTTAFGISNYLRLTAVQGYTTHSNTTIFDGTAAIVNSQGFFSQSRIASNQYLKRYKGISQTVTRNSTTALNANFILSRTGNANAEYSNRELSFCTIGDGLTSGELITLETICNNFQTLLSRNV